MHMYAHFNTSSVVVTVYVFFFSSVAGGRPYSAYDYSAYVAQ